MGTSELAHLDKGCFLGMLESWTRHSLGNNGCFLFVLDKPEWPAVFSWNKQEVSGPREGWLPGSVTFFLLSPERLPGGGTSWLLGPGPLMG